ncbi:hypothetical protein AAF712_012277 [Marasmius tenuissimus]|uniref:Copper transport protein n=1 Tax=Marasmius tenuissimus TaxID=585030 RepID=A0ABR2ZHX0_9AGAR
MMNDLSSTWRPLTIILVCALFCTRTAADNGMDMDMDMPMPLASGNVLMYFHFTPGDILWFEGWVPKSTGAMVGTCIGLFLLAMVERWISAMRGVMEGYWRVKAQVACNALDSVSSLEKETEERPTPQPSVTKSLRRGVPFIPPHDIVRGIMHSMQAALGYALMLAVMTYQLSFLIAIVVGLGVGEAFFGRYSHITTARN